MNDIIIEKRNVNSLCQILKKSFTVYGVTEKEKGHYVFAEIEEFADPLKDYKPTILPPKKYLFPQQETLLRFDTKPHTDVRPVVESRKQILFGVRPCDIHGINLLDKVFTTDHEDTNYTKKRGQVITAGSSYSTNCIGYPAS